MWKLCRIVRFQKEKPILFWHRLPEVCCSTAPFKHTLCLSQQQTRTPTLPHCSFFFFFLSPREGRKHQTCGGGSEGCVQERTVGKESTNSNSPKAPRRGEGCQQVLLSSSGGGVRGPTFLPPPPPQGHTHRVTQVCVQVLYRNLFAPQTAALLRRRTWLLGLRGEPEEESRLFRS